MVGDRFRLSARGWARNSIKTIPAQGVLDPCSMRPELVPGLKNALLPGLALGSFQNLQGYHGHIISEHITMRGYREGALREGKASTFKRITFPRRRWLAI
jgi:hypothetical protein